MTLYQRDEEVLSDEHFEPGEYVHLVVGNGGRLLDARRTPVRLVELRPETGFFVVRIEGFEDQGALWEVPFEEVGHYQFAAGEPRAGTDALARIRAAIARLDRPLRIACTPTVRGQTCTELEALVAEASQWLARRSRFIAEGRLLPDPDSRRGDELLCDDLEEYLGDRGLAGMERAFAEQFVSNPYSGERITGHRIVLAELGLVPFEGKVIRDPRLFDGEWSRQHRARHLLARLAFVRAVFGRLGLQRVRLYRGLSCEPPLRAQQQRSFVSATFCEEVARSHFDSGDEGVTRVLWSQAVPVERLFMTYLETAPMNRQFLEAEAVLLWDPENRAF